MAKDGASLSGFRDMLAEQMIARQHMIATIQSVYELYGFTPLKTPSVERYETLAGKYGEEGEKLMYKFEDNGGTALALRYDHTVPLARVVAQHSGELPLPYKRYAVGEVWRGDRPQAGRYREFMQFDADIVGTTSALADTEIVLMMYDSMKALKTEAVVRVNNRRILDALAQKAGVFDAGATKKLFGAIDKVDKVGIDHVVAEISSGFSKEVGILVKNYLTLQGSSEDKLSQLSSLLSPSEHLEAGLFNLQSVFEALKKSGYTDTHIVFDQTIARGLDYYTGIIYETNLKALPQLGSVCSGGRYDNLVKALGGPDLPAVGTSVGVDRLFDGLLQLGLLPQEKTLTTVLILNFDDIYANEYMRIATELRAAGIAAEIYYKADKVGKQIGHANKIGIPFVLIMGENEKEKGVVLIKNLESGFQEEINLDNLVGQVQRIVSAM